MWHPCADSSGNGYTPNKLPFETREGHLGVLGGQTFKSLEKMSNGWIDWHQLWFTHADSSGNGHRLASNLVHVCGFVWEWTWLNTIRPSIPWGGGHFGGLGGHNFKSGKLPNGWTDWHQIRYTSVDSSGNGHRLKPIRP